MSERITIIGAGLAGCEAAIKAASSGFKVDLLEMKPLKKSPAHSLDTLSELVCSNSLKAEGLESSSGLLKEELRILGSAVISAAERSRVPAGSALAVDRRLFSETVTAMVKDAGVNVIAKEVVELPAWRPLIVATGPLTTDALFLSISNLIGKDRLHFYDAVAPIVYAGSIDKEKVFSADRYGKGESDYLNCPMDESEYDRFIDALTAADNATAKDFEDKKVFEACMPIEAMAKRGRLTLCHGPMRPVGLVDPRTGKRPFAIVQLRREDINGALYNIVGFQTRLTYQEQRRILRLIPGLENAEFARLGKIHRNSYIDSPGLLEPDLNLKTDPKIFFAGQITGVEGYCESAMTGIIAGINASRALQGKAFVSPPPTTMTGALLAHISTRPDGKKGFSPMNSNFGLLGSGGKKDRPKLAQRAIRDFSAWRDEVLEK